jgi:hypothetical protein
LRLGIKDVRGDGQNNGQHGENDDRNLQPLTFARRHFNAPIRSADERLACPYLSALATWPARLAMMDSSLLARIIPGAWTNTPPAAETSAESAEKPPLSG